MIFNIPSEFRGAYKGEQKVHEAFKNMFAEKKYFAIHSVGLANHETKKKGECDFILITDAGHFVFRGKRVLHGYLYQKSRSLKTLENP